MPPPDRERPLVLLLSYYFPPSGAVGGSRPFRFYKYLKRLGYTCQVVTASEQPTDPPPDVVCVPDTCGPIWEGKSRGPLTWKGHVERLIRRFLIPGCTGVAWAIDASNRCREIVKQNGGRPIVLFSTSPPVGAGMAGLLAAIRTRVRWIADFRDPMSFGSGILYFSRCTRFILSRLEAGIFRRAHAVIANVEPAAEVWRGLYPDSHSKLHVIWNGYDPEDRLRALPCRGRAGKTIVHAGELYEGRNPNLVLEALARLRRDGAPEALAARILLVGPIGNQTDIDWALCDAAVREGWLELRKPIPKQEVRTLVAQSEGLLLLQPQSGLQVPAKLFEYVTIGRPILALVPPSSAVEYILQNAGVLFRAVYPSDTPEAAGRKILEFLRLPSDPSPFNSWFQDHFDAAAQTAQLASIIDAL